MDLIDESVEWFLPDMFSPSARKTSNFEKADPPVGVKNFSDLHHFVLVSSKPILELN